MKFPFVSSLEPLPQDQVDHLLTTDGFDPNPRSLAIYAQTCLTGMKECKDPAVYDIRLAHLDAALEDCIIALTQGTYIPPPGVKWKKWPW